MTEADRQTEVLANWARAQESLAAAGLLLANRHFDFAASRAYYAAFYAASALLLSQGREVTKHSGVLAAINRDFVRTGVLDKQAGRALVWLFELRGIGDYGETSHVPAADADEALAAAQRFVGSCGEILRGQGVALPEQPD